MNSAATHSVDSVRIPAAGRIPSDMAALNSLAVLSFCPAKGAQHRAASRHIALLIADALAV